MVKKHAENPESTNINSTQGLGGPRFMVSVGPFCFTSTEARWLIRDEGSGGGGDERVKARPRIPPEKDRRDRGPPPEQWKR